MSSRVERLAARFNDLAQPVPTESADGPQHTPRSIPSAVDGMKEEIPTGGERRHPAPRAASWDATHRRVTYWMHVDVISDVRRAAQRGGESAASFVDRALRNELRRGRDDSTDDLSD